MEKELVLNESYSDINNTLHKSSADRTISKMKNEYILLLFLCLENNLTLYKYNGMWKRLWEFGKETLPREWSDKKQQSWKLGSEESKWLRRDPP